MLANRDQTQANQDLDRQKTGVSQEPKGKFRTGQTLISVTENPQIFASFSSTQEK